MTKLNIDCLSIIFNELQNKNSLFSCLLVNKEWCNVTVPILWKNLLYDYNEKLIDTIISLLPPSSKQLLFDNDIKLPSTILLKPPLFNYLGFCKFPRAENVREIIEIVVRQCDINRYKRNLLEQEIYKLFISQCKNIIELHLKTSQRLSTFPGASECFSHLYNLYIDIDLVTSDSLYGMAQICKDLNTISICNCFQDLPGLNSLIDAQSNLRRVNIEYCDNRKGSCEELGKALAKKGNTMNYLKLSSPSFLTSLINLKKLSIHFNENMTKRIKEFQQYLAIAEFPNLQHLETVGLPCFKEISLLIEKTKGNASIVDISCSSNKADAQNTGMLIKSIANNCPNIKNLLTQLEPECLIHVKLLLLNCRNLESITIRFDCLNFFVRENNNMGNELIDILTNFSPKSLTSIVIDGDWMYSLDSVNRFLESCRYRTLDRFDIKPSITKYKD